MRPTIAIAAALLASALLTNGPARACTNYLVTRGASADGSTMITYAADSHVLYGELYHYPAGKHIKGSMRRIHDWDSGKYLGDIPESPVTYSVIGNINEYQVSIGETTWGGRKELKKGTGTVDYGSLMYIALQRARTAREAIKVMTWLVQEHGYASSGESFSIADPYEVWFMDMIGKGEEDKGAVWVARKVPEGYVSAHANAARIRKFPLKDKRNTLYVKDVISFARDKGWYEGADKDFDFAAVYNPDNYGARRICEARVWAFFNRIAPSKRIGPKYFKYINGVPGAKPLPLWIKPDEKLSVRDVIELMRDHYEGTRLDMTKDLGAGPYELPYRWRPLRWEVEGERYINERAVSTQQTGFSFVSQARHWMPDAVGGVLWFSVDDTFSTVYVPMYAGIRAVPEPYAVGTADFETFSWDSAWWVFNFVANWAYTRYSDVIADIQVVQRELEGKFVALQPEIERRAVDLYDESPEKAREYLTAYSVAQGEMVVERWRKLGIELFMKYMDGNVRDAQGKVTHPGYPEEWYRRIVEDTGKKLKYNKIPGEPEPEH
jgi:dipeptidase